MGSGRSGRRLVPVLQITEMQKRFAEEYVFGKIQPNLGCYADIFGVARETVSSWLKDELVRKYIEELRQQRQELVQQHVREHLVETALTEIESVSKLDPRRTVNSGRKNEYKVYDPALIDRKLRASESLLDFAFGKEDIRKVGDVANTVKDGVNVTVNTVTNAQAQAAPQPTLEELEALLRAKDVLGRTEQLVVIEDLNGTSKPDDTEKH